MRYLLDTCAISEFVKPRPAPAVVAWMETCEEANLYLSVLTFGEIRKGIDRLPSSKRRAGLESWLEGDLVERFEGRVLDVDKAVALRWGAVHAEAESRGETLPIVDALIAATAAVHGLTVVTRNRSDIERAGARVVDPWGGQPKPGRR